MPEALIIRHVGQSNSWGDLRILAINRAGPTSPPHRLQRSIASSTKTVGVPCVGRSSSSSRCKACSGQIRHASHAVHRAASKMSCRAWGAPASASAPSGQRSAQAPHRVHRAESIVIRPAREESTRHGAVRNSRRPTTPVISLSPLWAPLAPPAGRAWSTRQRRAPRSHRPPPQEHTRPRWGCRPHADRARGGAAPAESQY